MPVLVCSSICIFTNHSFALVDNCLNSSNSEEYPSLITPPFCKLMGASSFRIVLMLPTIFDVFTADEISMFKWRISFFKACLNSGIFESDTPKLTTSLGVALRVANRAKIRSMSDTSLNKSRTESNNSGRA